MANTIRTVKLPDGTMQKVNVPEEWGASDIREALVRKGVIAGEAASTPAPANPAPAAESDMPPFVDPAGPETAPSKAHQATRQLGLGIRNVTEGAAAFPIMIGDAANTLANFIPGVELGLPSRVVQEGIEAAGLPEPRTRAERMAASVQHAAAGTMAGIGAARNLTTPFTEALTTQAGQQTVAGTAAGLGFGAAAEADLGPIGQIVVGLGAGLAGAAGASQVSKQFAKAMDSRIQLNDRVITEDEVSTLLAKDGVDVPKDSDELMVFTEQLNELRVQQRAQEEIRRLAPTKTDTVEQRRLKERERARLGGGEEKVGLEVRRERDRLLQRKITEVEGKIRKAEEAAPRAEPEAKAAEAVRSRSEQQATGAVQAALIRNPEPTTTVTGAAPKPGEPLPIVRGDNTVPKTKTGATKFVDRFGNDLIGRVQKLSPQMAMAVRRVTQRSATRSNRDVRRVNKFYQSKELAKLPKAERAELDRAFLNGDRIEQAAIMGRVPGLQELYDTNVKSLLSGLQARRKALGADGFIEDFHPRVVRNVGKLRTAANRNQTAGRMDQALADAERLSKQQRGHGLNEREVAALINQHVGGRPLKVMKDRRINEIPKEHQRYYENSHNSLIDYLHKYHTDDATREFFKNSLGKEVDFGKNAINEATLGQLMAQSLEARGGLTPQALGELADLLSIHFGVSRQGVGDVQRNVKNVFTAGTLANPISTLTQFGDLAPVMSKFGVFNSLKHLRPNRKGDIDVYDIGVRELSKDTRDARGTGKLVKRGLEAVGFNKLDKIMANTAVNASFGKRSTQAFRSKHQLKKELEPFFGAETDQLIKDLQARRLTDNVKTMILHDIGDIRPVSREDMPVEYNRNPDGRWKYSLLSWTLKQMNFVRNNAQKNWRDGKRIRAVKDIGTLAVMMGITNGSVQNVKDFLLGRDVDPASNLVKGMLALGMSGKYAVDALSSNRGAEAIGALVPFLGIGVNAVQKSFNAVTEADPTQMIDAFPSGRNIKNLILGDIVPIVGAGVTALTHVIPQTQPDFESVPKDRGMPTKVVQQSDDELGMIKSFENPLRVGRFNGSWLPHKSIEGGTDTLGYGHKLTAAEDASGKIRIDGELVSWKDGLSDGQIQALLEQDTMKARRAVLKLVKVPLASNEMEALLSLVFNVGGVALAKSNALKALNRGDREEFMKQAFDPVVGFVKVNGVVNRGLAKRREKERRMFAGE